MMKVMPHAQKLIHSNNYSDYCFSGIVVIMLVAVNLLVYYYKEKLDIKNVDDDIVTGLRC